MTNRAPATSARSPPLFGINRAQLGGNDAHRPDDARVAFGLTLDALGSEYVDLFLIHSPLPERYDGDFVSTWKTLEEFYREGRARSIGVSTSSLTICADCTRTPRPPRQSTRSRCTRT
jgi:aryl-alcohol dehydrogenase-like predicted oxidoreductase